MSGGSAAPPVRTGRPRRISFTQPQLLAIAGMAARGATEATIAAHLGISERGLRKVLARDHRARESYDQGRAQLHHDLVGELVRRALDPKAPQSTVALIFATKALLHLRDQGDPPAADDVARLKVELTLPRALPLDRYRELVDAARRRLPSGSSRPGEAEEVACG